LGYTNWFGPESFTSLAKGELSEVDGTVGVNISYVWMKLKTDKHLSTWCGFCEWKSLYGAWLSSSMSRYF